jgi:hypothetical protein
MEFDDLHPRIWKAKTASCMKMLSFKTKQTTLIDTKAEKQIKHNPPRAGEDFMRN